MLDRVNWLDLRGLSLNRYSVEPVWSVRFGQSALVKGVGSVTRLRVIGFGRFRSVRLEGWMVGRVGSAASVGLSPSHSARLCGGDLNPHLRIALTLLFSRYVQWFSAVLQSASTSFRQAASKINSRDSTTHLRLSV